MKYYLIISFFILTHCLSAQVDSTKPALPDTSLNTSPSLKREIREAISYEESLIKAEKPRRKGNLEVITSDSLQLLIDGYNEQKELIGYRIQLFSGRSRMEAVRVKSEFHSKYGESELSELLYQQPNFKIRIGNYRDRFEATKALNTYKIDFPSAFLVKDAIKMQFD